MIILIVLFIYWTSPQPIDASSQQVTVTGGTLRHMEVADNGRSGVVEIEAPIVCATIDWSARTVGGTSLHTMRAWRDGCYKAYIP